MNEHVCAGYVTCNFLRDAYRMMDSNASNANSNYPRSNGGNGGNNASQSTGNVSIHGIPLEPTYRTIHKMYKNEETVLKSCAFLVDLLGFQRCIMSLMKAFDLRGFFGGMSAYHDCQRMADLLGVQCDARFTSNFVDGKDGKADPVAISARYVYIFACFLVPHATHT